MWPLYIESGQSAEESRRNNNGQWISGMIWSVWTFLCLGDVAFATSVTDFVCCCHQNSFKLCNCVYFID